MSLTISQISRQWGSIQVPKERIRLQMYPDICSPESVVHDLALIEGSIDIYFWYVGAVCLPQVGADFMKKSILKPLYERMRDAKFYLYSLEAWDFKRNVSEMPLETDLGEAINRINKAVIECLYSSSFFQYCTNFPKENEIYKYVNQELQKKKWLMALSEKFKNKEKTKAEKKEISEDENKEMTVSQLFSGRISLFDCIKESKVSAAYSQMQYVEGYYLIQKSVKEGLSKGQKKIQIAFVLPNDESKFYLDYPKDIEKMLRLDFGEKLSGVEIDITFRFFKYEKKRFRPYIDRRPNAPQVKSKEVCSYFDYLTQQPLSKGMVVLTKERQSLLPDQPKVQPRDEIHNFYGGVAK